MHKLKFRQLKDFIILQNILFINGCFEEERIKSFNNIFKELDTNKFHNTKSPTEKMKRRDFKTLKFYGPFSILNKNIYQAGTYSKMR